MVTVNGTKLCVATAFRLVGSVLDLTAQYLGLGLRISTVVAILLTGSRVTTQHFLN
jgi:hypothetical protein